MVAFYYNPHTATKIAPNKFNDKNKYHVLMNISKRAKKKREYPKLEIGDNVRVPVIENHHDKWYKDSFSMEMHKVEFKSKGLYTVDGSLHPRKDLQ